VRNYDFSIRERHRGFNAALRFTLQWRDFYIIHLSRLLTAAPASGKTIANALYPDRDEMHDSFDDWLGDAQQTEQFLKAEGYAVKRVIVDPAELADWRAVRGIEPIATARAEYVTVKARRRSQASGGKPPFPMSHNPY
jgi:hypothetical protein